MITIALVLGAILALSLGSVITVYGQQQQPLSSSSNGISILSSSMIRTDPSYLYIVGEVRNDLPDAVEFVQVVGTFYDSGGLLIDTDYTYTDLDQLRPGEKSPFELIISDESIIQNIATYELSVTGDRIVGSTAPKPAALELEEGNQRINENGWYEIVGEVTNTGSQSTEFVKVIATFYDDTGTVIQTDYTYTDPADLAAGQSAPFEIIMTDEGIAENVESVKLTSQSDDYFMIDPEVGQGTQQTQQQAEDTAVASTAATFESMTDGFRLQVPDGWVVEDLQKTNVTAQRNEEQSVAEYLAHICLQEQSLPVIGGTYQCQPPEDTISIMRLSLQDRPEFASLLNSSGGITASDLLAWELQMMETNLGYSNFRMANNTDRTVAITNAETNQSVTTIPAKFVEFTYSAAEGAQIRQFGLLMVNETTGFHVLYEGLASSLPSGNPPSQVQQIFDSIEFLAPTTSTGTAASLPTPTQPPIFSLPQLR